MTEKPGTSLHRSSSKRWRHRSEAVARARVSFDELASGRVHSLAEIARSEGIAKRDVERLATQHARYRVTRNVLLVDLREIPIERITAEGVMTSDGLEHKLNVLILATGFDMVSGGLTTINIKGTSGQTLRDKWKSGISACLGSATHGFPNMLFLYGPQAPAGLSNGPSSAELPGDEIVELLKFMKDNGRLRLHARLSCAMARTISRPAMWVRRPVKPNDSLWDEDVGVKPRSTG